MARKTKLEEVVRGVQSEIEALRGEIKNLANITARYVLPQEAMDDLTGELRALRQLLDSDGKYTIMDAARARRDTKKAREGRRGGAR
jgi:hypothetical protein